MKKIKDILKDKSGSVLVLCMGWLLVILIALSPLYVFAECNAQVSNVKETSQNSLDVYTVKMGKEIMKSIKNGNDFTHILDKSAFITELKNELGFRKGEFVGVDAKGNMVLEVKNIKAEFIMEKSLKTKITYEVIYQFYFMGKPLFRTPFNIVQESRYNLR